MGVFIVKSEPYFRLLAKLYKVIGEAAVIMFCLQHNSVRTIFVEVKMKVLGIFAADRKLLWQRFESQSIFYRLWATC